MAKSPARPPSNAALVFSTGVGRICPGCRRPAADCVCRSASGAAAGARAGAPVRVSRQTQGRAGRGVTVISGLPLSAEELEQLAGELKRRCGSGGTVREGSIEIQGEHRDTLVAELARRGITAKRAGG
ncbi:MAG TPA: translation initiation factor Sui1 [Steroidobacteraceae bacterium]|nr:translation initiation factor Sui1 [Steroidobacteraceae bacterium]